MGRTIPPARQLVEDEINRLRRIAKRLRDPQARKALEGILDYTYNILEAYRYEPMSDPLEPILLAGLVKILIEYNNNSQS